MGQKCFGNNVFPLRITSNHWSLLFLGWFEYGIKSVFLAILNSKCCARTKLINVESDHSNYGSIAVFLCVCVYIIHFRCVTVCSDAKQFHYTLGITLFRYTHKSEKLQNQFLACIHTSDLRAYNGGILFCCCCQELKCMYTHSNPQSFRSRCFYNWPISLFELLCGMCSFDSHRILSDSNMVDFMSDTNTYTTKIQMQNSMQILGMSMMCCF